MSNPSVRDKCHTSDECDYPNGEGCCSGQYPYFDSVYHSYEKSWFKICDKVTSNDCVMEVVGPKTKNYRLNKFMHLSVYIAIATVFLCCIFYRVNKARLWKNKKNKKI